MVACSGGTEESEAVGISGGSGSIYKWSEGGNGKKGN